MKSHFRFIFSLGLLALLTSYAPQSYGQINDYWQGTGTTANPTGGDWSTTTNWSANVVPVLGDTAHIEVEGSYTISASSNPTGSWLKLNDAAKNGGTANINLGGNTLVFPYIEQFGGSTTITGNVIAGGTGSDINSKAIDVDSTLRITGDLTVSSSGNRNWIRGLSYKPGLTAITQIDGTLTTDDTTFFPIFGGGAGAVGRVVVNGTTNHLPTLTNGLVFELATTPGGSAEMMFNGAVTGGNSNTIIEIQESASGSGLLQFNHANNTIQATHIRLDRNVAGNNTLELNDTFGGSSNNNIPNVALIDASNYNNTVDARGLASIGGSAVGGLYLGPESTGPTAGMSGQNMIIGATDTYLGSLGISVGSTATFGANFVLDTGEVLLNNGTFNAPGITMQGGTISGSGALATGINVPIAYYPMVTPLTLSSQIGGLGGDGYVEVNSPNVLTVGAGNHTGSNFTGVLQGTGGLTKTGTGTQTLSGANTYTGPTVIGNGKLTVANAAALGTAAGGTTINNSGGAPGQLEINPSAPIAIDEPITIASSHPTADIINSAENNSWLRSLDFDLPIRILMSGSSSLELSGANAGDIATTGTGSLTVKGTGTLAISGNATHSGGTTIESGASLQIGKGGLKGTLAGDVVNNGQLMFDRSDANVFAGDISGTGGLTAKGGGQLTLSGVNTYEGGTTLDGSNLVLGSATALPTGGSVTVQNGAGIDYGANSATIGALSGSGTQTIASGKVIDLGNDDGDGDFSGVISGAGGVVKSGTGKQILRGLNTFTGPTTVNNGILEVGNPSALGTAAGTTTVAAGGSLQIGAINYTTAEPLSISGAGPSGATGALTARGTAAWSGGAVSLAADSAIHMVEPDADFTINAPITKPTSTPRRLTFRDAGGVADLPTRVTLTNNGNDWDGGTVISGKAELRIGDGGSDGRLPTVGGVNLQSAASQLTFDRDNSVGRNYDRPIQGSGKLNKRGSGVLTIGGTAANTFTGPTTVSGGELRLAKTGGAQAIGGDLNVPAGGRVRFEGDNQLPSNRDVIVNDGGEVDLNGRSQTTRGLRGNNAGGLKLGVGGRMSFGNGAAMAESHRFDGVISGDGEIVKTGPGTQILGGANTHTGRTTISRGTLQLADSGRIDSSLEAVVNNGATLEIKPNSARDFSVKLRGDGDVRTAGTQNVTINNPDNSGFTGRYFVGDTGRMKVNSIAAMGDPSRVDIAAGAVFDVSEAATAAGGPYFDPRGTDTNTPIRFTGNGSIDVGPGNKFGWTNGVELSSGNSIGTISTGPVVATDGMIFNWELLDGTGGNAPGVDYDNVVITGDLDIDGLTAGGGIINVSGIDNTNMAVVPPTLDISQKGIITTFENIITATTITGVFDANDFTINFGNLGSVGTFDIALNASGVGLDLVFTSTVPEPSTWVLFALLAASGFIVIRKRKSRESA